MRARFIRWLVVAPLAWGACAPPSATRAHPQVDALFGDFDSPDSPGAAVLVVRDGDVVYRNGFGMASLEHGVPISTSTVFDIASVSKQFAGISVAMLVESGEIALDDDIRAHLPEMPDFENTITVDHLVHHTSGLRDWPGTLAVAGWRMDDVISFDQILRFARNQRDLNFVPGAENSYSNTGYNVLAEMVARVSGTSFRSFTQERVFGPLRMTDTHFHDDHTEVVPNRAQGYSPSASGFQSVPNGLTALGSSSLYTTAEDLAKWVTNFDDGRVGGVEVIELMERRGVLNSGEQIAYAFGQSRGTYRGLETWSHSGSWAGFRTVLTRFPAQRFGVVILSNLGSYNPSPAALQIADIFLADELGPVLDEPEEEAGDETAEAPTRQRGVELREYAGEYYSPELDTSYRLTVRDGRLVANHRRHGDIGLIPLARDEFGGAVWFIPVLEFDRAGGGEVTGFRITQGRSRNIRFEAR